MTDRSTGSPTNDDGADTQLRDVQQRLVRDGTAAGVDESVITKAIDDAAEQYSSAPVRSFVGVLVEREVREQLSIRPTNP